MTPELTEEQIAEAMARAEKVACRPGDDRCYPLPYSAEEARKTCTPKGRCKVGWIVANSGRDSWDVWLDLHTGEGRFPKAFHVRVRVKVLRCGSRRPRRACDRC